MQKPNTAADGINLWPLARFRRKMVICATAPIRKRARKTAEIGTSTDTVGVPPKAAFDGGYGGPGIIEGRGLAEGDDMFSKLTTWRSNNVQ
jgi:hypothetical protein